MRSRGQNSAWFISWIYNYHCYCLAHPTFMCVHASNLTLMVPNRRTLDNVLVTIN